MDESALVAAYERYHQQLYRYCFAIVGNAEDAQDALQNAMVKALRALSGEQRQIELKPWLYRIAHNESIDLLRKRRGEARIDPELLVAAGTPEEAVATREHLRRLLADLADLPGRQREALVMRELGGLSFAEISTTFETTPEVARQTIYEARLNLRQLEAGREMDCAKVTRQISDADGRVLRRRDIQAHLRACPECRAFRDSIEGRQRDLAAIAPLPAVAAAGILQGLFGGAAGSGAVGAGATANAASTAGTGASGVASAVGVGAGKLAATSVVVKSVAALAVVAAVGVGAADRGGLIDAGLPGNGSGQSVERVRSVPGADAPATGGEPAEQDGSDPADQQASTGGVAGGVEERTAQADPRPASTDSPAGTQSPSAQSDSLPSAASQGQEVAASHGGGRAHGQSHAQAKGNPEKPNSNGKEKPETTQGKGKPAHPAHSANPTPDPKPSPAKAKPKPKPAKTGQVEPDVSPDTSFQPSQPPKSKGATGAAGGPPSKEAR